MKQCKLFLLALVLFGCVPLMGYSKGKMIQLPKPNIQGNLTLSQAIEQRRSVRHFSNKPITKEQLSQLLWAGQGVTDSHRQFRAAPSAGALYPLCLYVVRADGVWAYAPKYHQLRLISSDDMRKDLALAAYHQMFIAKAPLLIVITAKPEITARKYGPRAALYIYTEAGHAAQNMLLMAEDLGLGAVPIGGFNNKAASKILHFPKNITVVYMVPVGHR